MRQYHDLMERILADGAEIRTTNEALLLIDQRFADAVPTELLKRTRALLATAALTGRRADIKAASEAMASVLCQTDML